jgi:hypothetical protein
MNKTIILASLLLGCSPTKIVENYCDYVQIPEVIYPPINQIDLQYSVNAIGVVTNLKHSTLIRILDKVSLLHGTVDTMLLENTYYREKLIYHNHICYKL